MSVISKVRALLHPPKPARHCYADQWLIDNFVEPRRAALLAAVLEWRDNDVPWAWRAEVSFRFIDDTVTRFDAASSELDLSLLRTPMPASFTEQLTAALDAVPVPA